jgi:uncharacterized protein DUF3768
MKTKTEKIAELNDLCRRNLAAARVVQTEGISFFAPWDQLAIQIKVATFDDFTDDNNPHGERDFGAFEYGGERIFWKIDYYDKTLTAGSEDPSDPAQTTRVLTIMLASEY